MSAPAPLLAASTREEWLALRPRFIGASESAGILGANPWASPASIWARKVGLEEDDAEASEAAEWGLRLEPVVADAYADRTGRTVTDPGRFTVQLHPEHEILGATLDRVLPEAEGKEGPGVLEIKTTHAFNASAWEDGPPLHYQIQVQHQMAVTGYRWGAVAVLIGGNRLMYADVERNDRFIDVLVEKLTRWWDRYVVAEQMPEVDGSEATAKVLRLLYPTSNGQTISLPSSFAEVAADLDRLKEERKRVEAAIRAHENAIKAALGENECGVLPDGSGWTYRSQTRGQHVVKESTFRVLRRKG